MRIFCMSQETQTGALYQPRGVGWGSRWEGEDGRYAESNMETYTTIRKIDSQWEFVVWLRKHKQGLCINLEGWNGEEDGREAQKEGDICIPMADSC